MEAKVQWYKTWIIKVIKIQKWLTLFPTRGGGHLLTLSGLTLWNTSPGRGRGGQICPPLNYGYRSMFSLFSFSQGSFLGRKGSESKSTAIYLKKYSPESYWKNRHFLQNLKKKKNRYLETGLFVKKNAVKIKPRHIGCSFFCKRTVMDIHEKSTNLSMCL